MRTSAALLAGLCLTSTWCKPAHGASFVEDSYRDIAADARLATPFNNTFDELFDNCGVSASSRWDKERIGSNLSPGVLRSDSLLPKKLIDQVTKINVYERRRIVGFVPFNCMGKSDATSIKPNVGLVSQVESRGAQRGVLFGAGKSGESDGVIGGASEGPFTVDRVKPFVNLLHASSPLLGNVFDPDGLFFGRNGSERMSRYRVSVVKNSSVLRDTVIAPHEEEYGSSQHGNLAVVVNSSENNSIVENSISAIGGNNDLVSGLVNGYVGSVVNKMSLPPRDRLRENSNKAA